MVNNKKYTLPKEERLSWKRYIDQLFAEGQSFIAFPLRVVFLYVESEELPTVSIIASVSKKRFKRAVKRNYIKRLIRESYRLKKHDLIEPLKEANKKLLVGFLYVDKEIPEFKDMEKAMNKAFNILKEKAC